MTVIRIKELRKCQIANKILFGISHRNLVLGTDSNLLIGGGTVTSFARVNARELLSKCLKGKGNNNA